jgi:hypothetical protein
VPAYYSSFACLNCCKSFKRGFKAPKKTDKKQWEKIRFLFSHGFKFQKIRIGHGHHDTIPYPKTLEDAKEFVIKYKKYAIKE